VTGLLRIDHASRAVAGRTLWTGLNAELEAGDRLVVDGPSGVGKSLLLRSIAGLDAFTSGGCEFRGKSLAEWSMPAYRAQVMYVPQRAALAASTVRQALSSPFGLAVHQGKEFNLGVAEKLLSQLGRPPELFEAQTANLSGGELQSVLLARALLLNPTILLLDEVTAALDQVLAARAEELLVAWSEESERALVWVGHDPAARARVGTDVMELGGAPGRGTPAGDFGAGAGQ
jgi:putative ABC transport system ATP-binding protein